MQHVFVYGSLLFPEIAEGLCQCSIQTEEAVLKDYKRLAVSGADYPAIIEQNNSKVEGKLLLNLDQHSLEILTFFEGDEYDLTAVEVQTKKGGMQALVFTWKPGLNYLETFDWDKQQFKTKSLPFYVNEVVPETLEEYNTSERTPF